MNIGELQTIIANYLSTTTAALIVSAVDLTLLALNNARRTAERQHDFAYAQTNLPFSIASTGSSFANGVGITGGILASGSTTPNITTAPFNIIGSLNGFDLYAAMISSTYWLLFNNGTTWIISQTGYNPSDFFSMTSTAQSPVGTYAAHGAYSGNPVLSGESQFIGIKRVQNVSLPISGGFIPIEFLTNDDFNARLRMQTGRSAYNPGLTPRMLGFYSENPICIQQGQTLSLEPASQFTFPVAASLSVTQWMPDYVLPTDSDFFVEFAPEYLQWQGILECNKLIKFFVERREGNLQEPDVIVEATAAYNSLIEWDKSIRDGTSTPVERQAA